MSVLYLTAGGQLEWRLDDADEASYPIPTGATNLIRFDPATPANATVFADVKRITGQYSIVASVLRKNGVPVIGFPAPEDTTQQALRRAVAKAQYDALDSLAKLDRARDLVLLDEINEIRAALVPPKVPRTAAQVRNAIRGKLDSGIADGPPP